jgi:hypothetical protein
VPRRLFAGGAPLPPYLREKATLGYEVFIHLKVVATLASDHRPPGNRLPMTTGTAATTATHAWSSSPRDRLHSCTHSHVQGGDRRRLLGALRWGAMCWWPLKRRWPWLHTEFVSTSLVPEPTAPFVLIKRQAKKYCSLIYCERKTMSLR